ncbi:membrane protein [Streptomycetaceae bacterium MP113-05]|nr:membrane protein [Streptomycetaceae bacterium MP113-05]
MARQDTSETPGRFKQIGLTYTMTRRVDRRIGWILAGIGLGTFGVLLAIGFLLGHPVYLGILGFLLAFLAAAIVFGRRAERAAFGQMEGQPGAAAAVLDNIGRGWNVTPAVAMNRNQDVVHRAVGKPGIVLVGEGNANRLRSLLASEKRKMNRVVSDVPVHDLIVGDDEGQVPLKKLRTTMLKLPRVMQGSQITATNDRLRALGDLMSNMPMPKGPMPKNARMPKGPNGGRR